MRGQARRWGFNDFPECISRISHLVERAEQRSFTYSYWPQFDGLSHHFGVASREVAQHFTELEWGLDTLLRSLSGSNTFTGRDS